MKYSKYKLNKRCKTCNKLLLDKNKTGFCNTHMDRTGENNHFYGHEHTEETIRTIKRKTSIKIKKLWKDEKYRKKVIKGASKPRKESFKQEQSVRIAKWFKDNPKQRDIRSKNMKKMWADGTLTANNFSCNESKIQKQFFMELTTLIPFFIKKTIRNGKHWFFPDAFEDKNGIIIEFFGDYWHANPKKYSSNQIIHHNKTAQEIWDDDVKRTKTLESLGYKVIIIWEDEYKTNKENLFNSLNNLINWDSCSL